jgi:hypothetical protein
VQVMAAPCAQGCGAVQNAEARDSPDSAPNEAAKPGAGCEAHRDVRPANPTG